jgi:hypothetical protein
LTFGVPTIAAVPRLVLAAIVITVGLGGAFFVDGRMTSRHETIIPFHTIPTPGVDAGYSKPYYAVIDDNNTWSTVWTRAYCYPCQTAPQVDFRARTVLAVFMGTQPGPLYHINITQIVRSGSTTTVHVLWTKAGNCGEVALEVSPSFIADIPKTNDHITFANETFIMHC